MNIDSEQCDWSNFRWRFFIKCTTGYTCNPRFRILMNVNLVNGYNNATLWGSSQCPTDFEIKTCMADLNIFVFIW